eukprot:3475547-Pleurochrysis_carterae.AAC.4
MTALWGIGASEHDTARPSVVRVTMLGLAATSSFESTFSASECSTRAVLFVQAPRRCGCARAHEGASTYHEGRDSRVVGRVNLGALGYQEEDHLQMAMTRRRKQVCSAVHPSVRQHPRPNGLIAP